MASRGHRNIPISPAPAQVRIALLLGLSTEDTYSTQGRFRGRFAAFRGGSAAIDREEAIWRGEGEDAADSGR